MIEWLKLAASIIAMLFSAATFVYVQLDKKQRATVKSIDDLKDSVDKRFDGEAVRISRIEGELNRIPTRSEFDIAQERGRVEIVRIHERIDEINKNSQNTNLMIGQVLGELKQLTKGQDHG
jgi:hypothetical protein